MKTQILALIGAAALLAPAAASAQSLGSIFDCNKPGNKQGNGAIAGALIGGLLGNQIDDDHRTTGAIVGGLLGAAAGSAIGCNMSSNDTSRAEAATRQALNQNRSTTWSSGGTSGRIDIVDSYTLRDASAYEPDSYYRAPSSLSQVRFARGVQAPTRNYTLVDSRYESDGRVNLRASPSGKARTVGQLQDGEEFDAIAEINNDWLLVGRNGQAVGYVRADSVSPARYARSYADGRRTGYDRNYSGNRGSNYYDAGQTCRVFDQTMQRSGYTPTTQRFTACETSAGEWVIRS